MEIQTLYAGNLVRVIGKLADRLGRVAKSRGWNAADWRWIVQQESGGDPAARNPSSGAFGLGQFLGSTLRSYSRFGATSTDGSRQIDAMGKYIGDRYGNPTAAKAFWQAHHWYNRGGGPMNGGPMKWAGGLEAGGSFIAHGPTAFVAGEGQGKRRKERVTVTRENANVTRAAQGGITIEHIHVTVKVAGGAHSDAEIKRLAKKIGPEIAEEIREAIVAGTRAVVD